MYRLVHFNARPGFMPASDEGCMNKAASAPKATGRKPASWTQDPEGVRRNILAAARAEFV